MGFAIINLSGNGGVGVTSLSGLCCSTVFPPYSFSSIMTTVEGFIVGCMLLSFSFSWGMLLSSGEIMCHDLS
jgi:hypothetical protein